MSYRGLTTVSKKQLKILIILVFLTGFRDQVAG
ncbi:palindromic element RPE4 domain-containing protein [Rickettsia asembonensis]|nr:palindromic element RPE4 domain-containing protein [Rickettsia asembonensis]